MELTPAVQSPADRPMVDVDCLALKRARSLSPEWSAGVKAKPGPAGDKLKAPMPQAGRKSAGKLLLLLPAPPSSEGEVSPCYPCMDPPPSGSSSGMGESSALGTASLVNVPVKEGQLVEDGNGVGGGGWVEDRGKLPTGRRLPQKWVSGEGPGPGGPIRRVKARRSAEEGRAVVMGKGKVEQAVIKPRGRGSGAVAGGRAVGRPVGRPKPKPVDTNQAWSPAGGRGGAAGKGKAREVPGGDVGSPARRVQAGSPSKGLAAAEGGGGVRQLKFPDSPAGSKSSKLPSPRSPVKTDKNLPVGRSSPGGSHPELEGSRGQGHGDLVRRIKGAVQAVGEGETVGQEVGRSGGLDEEVGEGGGGTHT